MLDFFKKKHCALNAISGETLVVMFVFKSCVQAQNRIVLYCNEEACPLGPVPFLQIIYYIPWLPTFLNLAMVACIC